MSPPPAETQGVQVPLLGRLFEGIDEDNRLVVIDFGLGGSSLLDALKPYRARIDTLAIFDALSAWQAAETPQDQRGLVEQHMAKFSLEPVDWVLCWSVLNYMNAPMLQTLSQVLGPVLKPNASIHALIEYSSPTMPASPATCDLVFEDNKAYLTLRGDRQTIPSPRYTPKALEGMLKGFKAQNTILLSNGMQEYVFRPI